MSDMVLMATLSSIGIHLVQVTTDDREHKLWAAAASPEEALSLVLDAIPEGWTASLLPEQLTQTEVEALHLQLGEVREITRTIRMN